MEKVFVMSLILVMVALGGMLQNGYVHYERPEEVPANYERMIHYPETMPQVIINPTLLSYL